MIGWPRSLFGRNALLIVALIVLAEVTGSLLVRQLIVVPRVDRIAETVARTVGAVRAGLAALPREQRPVFVDAFRANDGSLLRRGAPRASDGDGRDGAGTTRLTPLERRFVRAMSARLAAADAEVVWRRDDDRSLSLRLHVDGDSYWLALPDVLPSREMTGAWLATMIAAALLAVLGALFIQRRIERPLRELVAAADALGHGVRPEPLDETGPIEIATVARSFNQLVASLDAADSERSVLLAGVSHDLRTPLTKLRLGVEILADGAGPELAASLARSIDEMDRLVGQFVDHARAGEAEPLETELVALDEIARDVAAAAADHGTPLIMALDGGPPLAVAPALLRRALMNLVENALRHGAPPVSIETGHDAASAWLDVVDAGTGIPTDTAAALRRPFQRAGSGGSGLGLAIVERVARRHGGRLELLAAAPRGLRARLLLPRA